MSIPGLHHVQVAVDCECGTSVEACDDEELLDELLEHIAAAHEADFQSGVVRMLSDDRGHDPQQNRSTFRSYLDDPE